MEKRISLIPVLLAVNLTFSSALSLTGMGNLLAAASYSAASLFSPPSRRDPALLALLYASGFLTPAQPLHIAIAAGAATALIKQNRLSPASAVTAASMLLQPADPREGLGALIALASAACWPVPVFSASSARILVSPLQPPLSLPLGALAAVSLLPRRGLVAGPPEAWVLGASGILLAASPLLSLALPVDEALILVALALMFLKELGVKGGRLILLTVISAAGASASFLPTRGNRLRTPRGLNPSTG